MFNFLKKVLKSNKKLKTDISNKKDLTENLNSNNGITYNKDVIPEKLKVEPKITPIKQNPVKKSKKTKIKKK